jgi:hypothetical protein
MRDAIGLVVLAALGLSGCADATGGGAGLTRLSGGRDFSSRRVPGDAAEVEVAAGRVFGSHFRIDREASTSRHLVSRPAELEGPSEARNVRDRIRLAPGRQRQVAELRLDPQGEGVLVQVSVRTQRLETTERASFARQRGDDRPNRTPIDRPGPSGVDTREEWVNAGRDTATEREILDEIAASLGASTLPAE